MTPTALKITAGIFLFCGLSPAVKAQSNAQPINVVTTAVPFLRISPDSRSGGMGDLGIATSADQYSGMWNIGKVAFNESNGGIGATYTPWLKNLVNDVYLATMSGYYKFDETQALQASLRYFSLGDIQFTDQSGQQFGSARPSEFSFDVGYSRKLSEKQGVGITLRYINSNLTGGGVTGSGGTSYSAASAVAADLGWYYKGTTGWSWGAVLSNLGSKISYTKNALEKDYIPANIGFGTNYTKQFNEQNQVSFGVEINKLLVPTPPADPTGPALAEYRNKSVVSSWISSLTDGDDLKELQVSLGAEYWYNNQFALRAGYFYENKFKGNRQYVTAGLGVKYNMFGFNFAYLLPTGSGINQSPLSNTLRFSILFDFANSGEGTKTDK